MPSSSRARSDTSETILKVLLVGESFVGKSSLAKRYTDAG
jgi:small GTP-binding protein